MKDLMEIVISEDGEHVTFEGVSQDLGSECQALSREIEEALGVVESVKLKPEFRRKSVLKRTVKA